MKRGQTAAAERADSPKSCTVGAQCLYDAHNHISCSLMGVVALPIKRWDVDGWRYCSLTMKSENGEDSDSCRQASQTPALKSRACGLAAPKPPRRRVDKANQGWRALCCGVGRDGEGRIQKIATWANSVELRAVRLVTDPTTLREKMFVTSCRSTKNSCGPFRGAIPNQVQSRLIKPRLPRLLQTSITVD
jgi:hypothetical protein